MKKTIKSPLVLTVVSIIIAIVATVIITAIYKHSGKTSTPAQQTDQANQDKGATSQGEPTTVTVGRLSGTAGKPSDLLPLGQQIEAYTSVHDPGSSTYIEDLTNHISVSVGETKAYNAKSLMKIPLVMTLYRAAELGRLNLDETETITGDELDMGFGSLYLKGAGSKITLRDAATAAIEQSDNTAIHVVTDHSFPVMPHDERSYIAMNLDMRTDENKQTFITARSYATVFRCLYTACYLNRQDSDALLSLMEQTDFSDPNRLLPKNVLVSHKVGDDGDQGFSDCGIVFGSATPQKPFIFCVMSSKGEPQAAPDVGQIVKLSYDFFQK
jgi:beta-lactamase class A